MDASGTVNGGELEATTGGSWEMNSTICKQCESCNLRGKVTTPGKGPDLLLKEHPIFHRGHFLKFSKNLEGGLIIGGSLTFGGGV